MTNSSSSCCGITFADECFWAWLHCSIHGDGVGQVAAVMDVAVDVADTREDALSLNPPAAFSQRHAAAASSLHVA